MNKTEKIICLLLGAVLAWYIFNEMTRKREVPADQPAAVAQAPASKSVAEVKPAEVVAAPVVAEEAPAVPKAPEQVVVLENDQLKLELSSWGAVVKKATLKGYARDVGEIGENNPAIEFDFASAPLAAIGGVPGLSADADYEVKETTSNSVTFVNAFVERKLVLSADYAIRCEDRFLQGINEGTAHADASPMTLSLGSIAMGASKNDLLSVDSMLRDGGKGREKIVHHCEGDSPLKTYLVGGSGGCGGSSSAAGLPRTTAPITVPGAQKWVAMKNRFFVVALACGDGNVGFEAQVTRDMNSANYRPESVTAKVSFADIPESRTSVFYVGPKKQSLLWQMGMKDVMEFGMWRWICYPLVWVLNFFNDFIPGYGIAIILLTLLVRLIFWPLTRKSTEGMKKLQEVQPLMKEIQAKYKDNPQRLQQETWALYREKKVNPMSSCLPMLVQIPIFIALFNVLRSAVELRYASFLWIADLSQPEGLFASWFPFGGLNILPILMAATMALQSALTPSTGDKSQQRMMMVIMPVMMLFMFYSFPSALSLYWTLSQVVSIIQMWLIRRQAAAKQSAEQPVKMEIIDPPVTRQMRRHS